MNEYLGRAILQMLASIELADDDSIDAHFAVMLYEEAAVSLRHLTKDERSQLMIIGEHLATELEDPKRSELVRSALRNLGLDDY